MPVHIYGAGGLGREVLAALTAADEKVVGFIVSTRTQDDQRHRLELALSGPHGSPTHHTRVDTNS